MNNPYEFIPLVVGLAAVILALVRDARRRRG
jgi:hypothetical protein